MTTYIEAKSWYEGKLAAGVALIAAVVTIVGVSAKDGFHFITLILDASTPGHWKIILCGLNLLVLFVFFFRLIKVPELKFKKKDPENPNAKETDWGRAHYCSFLDYESSQKSMNEEDHISGIPYTETNEHGIKLLAYKVEHAEWYNKRVERLVNQVNINILFYIIFLIFTYFLYIVDYKEHPWHTYFKIAVDITNYLSSVFIYLAFLVLYNETLDKYNNSNYFQNGYFRFVFLFTIVYVAACIILGIASSSDATSNRLSLIAGMVNGLAMMLLFSRYITMEHVVKHIKAIRYPEKLVSTGMLYLLPIYAIVQPLFGSFEIPAFGNPQKFANYVFLFCFIGKWFFLYVTYLFINRKLMHIYLHLVITPHDRAMLYEQCFEFESKKKK
jgi:hypothetical protein